MRSSTWGDEWVRFSVGEVRCTVIRDIVFDCRLEWLLASSQRGEWEGRLDPEGSGWVGLPVNCCLIETANRLILVDGGDGQRVDRPSALNGRLLDHLDELGVQPRDIDTVVITHVHSDHVAGLVAEASSGLTPVFPNAPHLISADELERMGQQQSGAERPPELARYDEAARAAFAALSDSGQLVSFAPEAEAEVAEGVRTLSLPGHTPGHSGVLVEDGNDTFVFLADAVHFELELELPHLHGEYDADPAQVVKSRRAAIELASARGAVVAASHLKTLAGWIDSRGGSRPLAPLR